METFSALLALCAGNSPAPVNSPHKGQWRGAVMFSLICPWINAWVNKREAGDLRRHRAYYDVIVMGGISGRHNVNLWCRQRRKRLASSRHSLFSLQNILTHRWHLYTGIWKRYFADIEAQIYSIQITMTPANKWSLVHSQASVVPR